MQFQFMGIIAFITGRGLLYLTPEARMGRHRKVGRFIMGSSS